MASTFLDYGLGVIHGQIYIKSGLGVFDGCYHI